MKIVWKNCSPHPVVVYVNQFHNDSGKYIIPGADFELDLTGLNVTKVMTHVFPKKVVFLLERQEGRKTFRVTLDGTEEQL